MIMMQENNYELLISGNDEIECLFVHIALMSAGILPFQPSYLVLGMIRQ